jgi:hypothetical protein
MEGRHHVHQTVERIQQQQHLCGSHCSESGGVALQRLEGESAGHRDHVPLAAKRAPKSHRADHPH